MKKLPCVFCLALLTLSACRHAPQWGGWPWEQARRPSAAAENAYQPLAGEEVAVIAAPKQALAEGGATPLFCRVSKGTARFDRKWLSFQTEDFSLPPDTRITVALAPTRGEGRMRFQSWFSQSMQEMLFCPVVSGPPDKKIPCASIYALDEDLSLGIKRTFDIPGAVMGGVLTCAKTPDKLKI